MNFKCFLCVKLNIVSFIRKVLQKNYSVTIKMCNFLPDEKIFLKFINY